MNFAAWNDWEKISPLLKKFLSSPITIVVSAIAGVLVGWLLPDIGKRVSLCGAIYLNFMKFISVPFIFSALASSIASLLFGSRENTSSLSLKKAGLSILTALLMTSIINFSAALLIQESGVWEISMENLDELLHNNAETPAESEIAFYAPPEKTTNSEFDMRNFLLNSLPVNLFQSLYHGNALHLLVASILFGFSLGALNGSAARNTIQVLSTIYQSCIQLVRWSLYFMPICVFSLLASGIATRHRALLFLLWPFVSVVLVLTIVQSLIGLVIWSRASKIPLKVLLKLEIQTLLLGFCATRSVVVLPVLMENMENRLHYPGEQVKLLVPFTFTMGKFNQITQFIAALVLAGHLYHVPFSLPVLILVLLLTPLIAIGGTFPIEISLLLAILGIPDELAITLLIGAGSFIPPFGAVQNTVLSAAFCSLLMKRNPDGSKEAAEIPQNNGEEGVRA